jgi:hypothetical protein
MLRETRVHRLEGCGGVSKYGDEYEFREPRIESVVDTDADVDSEHTVGGEGAGVIDIDTEDTYDGDSTSRTLEKNLTFILQV